MVGAIWSSSEVKISQGVPKSLVVFVTSAGVPKSVVVFVTSAAYFELAFSKKHFLYNYCSDKKTLLFFFF